MRRIILACGGLALLGFAAAVLLSTGWAGADHSTRSTEIVRQPINRIAVNVDSGNLRVQPAEDGQLRVERQIRYWGRQKPDQHSQLVNNDTLRLDGCGQNCTIDYEVRIPRDFPISGRLGSGNARINGAGDVTLDDDSGNLHLERVRSAKLRAGSGAVSIQDSQGMAEAHSDSGSVRLSGIGGPSDIQAGSGSVRADELRGSVKASVDSGSISLNSVVPNDIEARSGSGSVDIRVPENTEYRVRTQSGDNTSDVRVPNAPRAKHHIIANTDSGAIHLRANGIQPRPS